VSKPGNKTKTPEVCRLYKQSTSNQKRHNVTRVSASHNVWQDACSCTPLVKSIQTYCPEEGEKWRLGGMIEDEGGWGTGGKKEKEKSIKSE